MTSFVFVKCTLILLIHMCAAAITTIQMNSFATSGSNLNDVVGGGPSLNAAADKYIFAFDQPKFAPVRVIVYERDAQGLYSKSYPKNWPRKPSFVTTNGKWFGTLGSGFFNSFRLGAGGTFENVTEFSSSASYMQFLSDDTLVMFSNTFIDTYTYTISSRTKLHTQNVNFTVKSYFTKEGDPADSAPHVTDTTLAAYHPRGAVELYTRNVDMTWALIDEISIDTTQYRANRILWDGNDTIVLGDTTYVNVDTNVRGRVLIYSKASGSWTLTSVIEGSSLNIPAPGFFAYSMLMVDKNTIAIGAPNQPLYSGHVFLLQRVSEATWQITTEIVGRDSRYFFGLNVMKTNFELVIHTGDQYGDANWNTITQHVAVPGCSLPPTYTCSDIVLDTCSGVVDIPYDRIYTLTEFGQCTDVSIKGYLTDGLRTTFTLGFTRGSETFYCNSTITCPSPPINAPITAPGALPVNSPLSTSGPTTPNFVPTAGPAAPTSPNNIPVAGIPGVPTGFDSQTSGATDSNIRIDMTLVFSVIYSLVVCM